MMRFGRRIRDRRGIVAVEFAIVLPVLLLLMLGAMEIAVYFWTRNSLRFAVEEAARLAIVNAAATPAQIKTAVLARLPEFEPARLTVTADVTPDGTANFMRVTARYAWPSSGLTGLLPVNLGAAVASARMPVTP